MSYVAVVLGREKVGAVECRYGRLRLAQKEAGELSVLTLADKHSNNLVAFSQEHLLKGQRLREMPAAFALYYKQYFHGSITLLFTGKVSHLMLLFLVRVFTMLIRHYNCLSCR